MPTHSSFDHTQPQYTVVRAENANMSSNPVVVVDANVLLANDTSLVTGTAYYYTVAATSSEGLGWESTIGKPVATLGRDSK